MVCYDYGDHVIGWWCEKLAKLRSLYCAPLFHLSVGVVVCVCHQFHCSCMLSGRGWRRGQSKQRLVPRRRLQRWLPCRRA